MALSPGPTFRHHVFMTTRVWGRAGWTVFGATVAGIAAYMVSVGWNQASLIAGVVGFFVAVAGLALAVATHSPARGRFIRVVGVKADGALKTGVEGVPGEPAEISVKRTKIGGSVRMQISGPLP